MADGGHHDGEHIIRDAAVPPAPVNHDAFSAERNLGQAIPPADHAMEQGDRGAGQPNDAAMANAVVKVNETNEHFLRPTQMTPSTFNVFAGNVHLGLLINAYSPEAKAGLQQRIGDLANYQNNPNAAKGLKDLAQRVC